MDQAGLSMGSYQFYTGNSSAQMHQAFIDFFTTVTHLLGATNATARYAEDVWQLEEALAEVIIAGVTVYVTTNKLIQFQTN